MLSGLVVCWFPTPIGNNFYLLVDVLICLELFGVVRFENTNFKTVNFKNFTLFTGSIFFSFS